MECERGPASDKSGVEAWTKVALALERMQPATDSKPGDEATGAD
jgi:hypothetical protein